MPHCSYSKNYNQGEKKLSTVNYDTGEIIKEVETHVSPTGSLRKNAGKPEISQLDPEFIMELSDLMTISAKKYGKFNWALGQFFCTVLDSMGRHFFKLLKGEDIDEESGRHHVLHIAANCMILYRSFKGNKELLDDRRKWDE
jgi:hypothetical protein